MALPQAQPACLVLNQGRLVDCGNWKVSASWQAPANGVSGVYVARLVREDDAPAPWRSEGNDNPPATKPPAAPHSYGASGLGTLRDAMKEKRASHIVFVVRDDPSRSDVLFRRPIPWVAYNRRRTSRVMASQRLAAWWRAVAPRLDGSGSVPGVIQPAAPTVTVSRTAFFNAEYPLVRWLERNG